MTGRCCGLGCRGRLTPGGDCARRLLAYDRRGDCALMMAEAWIVLAALALEAAVGYPAALHARVPHPVVWAGNAINALERWWNQPQYSFAARRMLGAVAL